MIQSLFFAVLQVHSILYSFCKDGKERQRQQQQTTSASRRKTPSQKIGEAFCHVRMTVVYKDLALNEATVAYISAHTNPPTINQ